MALKLALIFATLAYVSAGAIETGVPPAVSYQYRTQVIKPSVPYVPSSGHSQVVKPVLQQPALAVAAAPVVKTFAVPTVNNYLPALGHGNGYGYAEAFPVVNYAGNYAAEPVVLATGAYGYTPAGHLGYDKYGHHVY